MASFTRGEASPWSPPRRVLGPAAKLVALLSAACVLAGWQAGAAFAGVDAFMGNQGLSAGNAYASASAHSGVDLIEGLADHTHCPTYATGYSGYTSMLNGGGHFTALSGTCGPGYWNYPVSIGSFVRGAERNPNVSTFDQFTWANYWW